MTAQHDADAWTSIAAALETSVETAREAFPDLDHAQLAVELAVARATRFRRVAYGYPRTVAAAYDTDIRAAMADSDAQVAARVAAWEREHGLPVRDWVAIGRDDEGRGLDAERAL